MRRVGEGVFLAQFKQGVFAEQAPQVGLAGKAVEFAARSRMLPSLFIFPNSVSALHLVRVDLRL